VNEWKPVFVLAKKSLIVFGVVLVLVIGLVLVAQQFEKNASQMLSQTLGELQNNQNLFESKSIDLKNMEEHIKRYETLKARGLVGEPQRALWVEEFKKSQVELKIPDLGVELKTSKPLTMQATFVEEGDGQTSQPLMHDLVFELRDVHEQEVLKLVDDYKNRVKGRFRLNECIFFEPKETGMSARCLIKLITIPEQQNGEKLNAEQKQ
jgi:hypothetical protein